jgi:hypothetical protein
MAKENEMLQGKNNDMKTTLVQNKQLLGTFIFIIHNFINR